MPNAFDYASLSLGIFILGFLWKFQRDVHRDFAEVHRDIANLRERMARLEESMARLEGLFERFTRATSQQS